MSNFDELIIVSDVDGCLADFLFGIFKAAESLGYKDDFPESSKHVDRWNICDKFREVFDKVKNDPQFWLDLPLLPGTKLDFDPYCYLTARPIASEVTEQWIRKVGLPDRPVITVKNPLDKIEILQEINPTIFIDDHYHTIIEARKAGINSVLFHGDYQRGHQEEIKGIPVIKSFKEIWEHIPIEHELYQKVIAEVVK